MKVVKFYKNTAIKIHNDFTGKCKYFGTRQDTFAPLLQYMKIKLTSLKLRLGSAEKKRIMPVYVIHVFPSITAQGASSNKHRGC